MKTSFYFVLWIIIYPVLSLFGNPTIDRNSFIIALVIVWGINMLVNRIMPKTIVYERVTEIAPILEDVYTGNVRSFSSRLTKSIMVQTLTAVYFTLSTVVIATTLFISDINDWISLAIFAFFAIAGISRTAALAKAKSRLNSDPTPRQCEEIAVQTYKLNYQSYFERRRNCASYAQILPPKPIHYRVYLIESLIFAGLATLSGLIYISMALISWFSGRSLEARAMAGMFFLYGTLALYYGVKDIVSSARSLRDKRHDLPQQPTSPNDGN